MVNYHDRYQSLVFLIALASSGLQIIVYNDDFRVGFLFS